jgi:hypothetical protein
VPDESNEPPQPPTPLDKDTLKGLFDLQKDTYALLESSIKTLEDKGRNNVVAATGAVGFALLILKPDAIAQSALSGFGSLPSSLTTLLAVTSLLALCSAAEIVVQIFRRNARIQSLTDKIVAQPRWLYEELPLEIDNHEQFLRTGAAVYFGYGTVVEPILDRKAEEVKAQFVGLSRLIVFTFGYLGLGAVALALRAVA